MKGLATYKNRLGLDVVWWERTRTERTRERFQFLGVSEKNAKQERGVLPAVAYGGVHWWLGWFT
jgi:hypothetical protein